ncbi:MAG: arsenite methyltransferase [Actinomycetota bacterium]|nr:arsenite methyltransferase [Actinomycetota bacterium]
MTATSHDEVRHAVRERYAQAAAAETSCCGPTADAGACCAAEANPEDISGQLGYSAADTAAVPDGANLGLGCGNPTAIAALRPGETVLDLGSGAGFDAFLAARAVGPDGTVIGVDMTAQMVTKARANADTGDYNNVEFRLGEIEHLPVADASIDVILSNCVINLSPDKQTVFNEAFRVLKPGGRLAIADVVASAELPPDILNDLALYAGCIGGAATVTAVDAMLTTAGFTDVRIEPKDESKTFMAAWAPGRNITDYVVSATIEASKPPIVDDRPASRKASSTQPAPAIDHGAPMPTIRVFEPALCCNTGVCGEDVDPALVTFTADLAALREAGADIERHNLANDPTAFAADPNVKAFLQVAGSSGLPLTLVNGVTVATGSYPSREQLLTYAGVNPAAVAPAGATQITMVTTDAAADVEDEGGCCGAGGCC